MTAKLKRTTWEEEHDEYPDTPESLARDREMEIEERASANLQDESWIYNELAYRKDLVQLVGSLGFDVISVNLQKKFDEWFEQQMKGFRITSGERHLAWTIAHRAFFEGHLLADSDRRLAVAKEIGKQLREKAYKDAKSV